MATCLKATIIEYWYRITFRHQVDINCIIAIISDYAKSFQVLQFDSTVSIELSDNDTCVKKKESPLTRRSHVGVSPKIKPVKHDIHVWRIKMNNPDKDWFCFGIVRNKIKGKSYFFEGSNNGFYGVSTYSQWYISGNSLHPGNDEYIREQIDMFHFGEAECEVDIYLDCDEGILKLCVVGLMDEKYEAQMIIPKQKEDKSDCLIDWTPHLIFPSFSFGPKIKIAQISLLEYGRHEINDWTSN